MKIRWILGGVAATLAVAALAHPPMIAEFNKVAKPPKDSALAKGACAICHVGMEPKLNPYGKDMAAAMKALKTKKLTDAVLKRIAKLDSDKDGVSNADELKAGTLPGDPESKPSK